jgi:hypothetical protein
MAKTIEIDSDVRLVMEFMQASIPAARLRSVSDKVNALAPLLWGHFTAEEVRAIALVSPPISDCVPHTQSSASEQTLG